MRSVVTKLIVALTASVVFGAGVVALNTASHKPGKPVPVQSSHKPGGAFSKCGGSHKPGDHGCGTGGTSSSGGAGGTIGTGGVVSSGGVVGSGGAAGGGSGGAVAAACGVPAPAGTIYYACDCGTGADANCVAGSDSNAGTSAASPFQSYEKARQQFAGLSGGDQILFCKGGAFSVTTDNSWVNFNTTLSNRAYVSAYIPPWASGDEGRPRITATGQDAFALNHGGTTATSGYVFAGLELIGDGSNKGYFIYNLVNGVTVCDQDIHGFSLGLDNDGSLDDSTPCDDVTLSYSTIHDNTGQGAYGAGNRTVITDNVFHDNGTRDSFDHNLYLSSPTGTYVGPITVTRNTFYHSTYATGRCRGASLVVHGTNHDLLIEGNTVYEDPGQADDLCWGISVAPGYTIAEEFRSVVIRGNLVRNLGNESIICGSCTGATIENNLIVNLGQSMNSAAIKAPDNEGAGDALVSAIVARNNSILIDAGAAISIGTEGSGHAIVDNAVHFASGGAGTACLDVPSGGTFSAIDYNICDGAAEWELGTGGASLSASRGLWQTASGGADSHSQATNPGFASVTSPYNLAAASSGSAIVNAGSASGYAPTDYTGASRPIGAASDVGAYER